MTKRGAIPIGIAIILTTSFAFADHDKQTSDSAQPAAVESTHPSNPVQGDRPVLQQRNPRYLIRKGDVLDLNFPFTPEFNQTVTVQPDGYITLRGLGDLQVEGVTKPQLTERLEKAYATILRQPVISVDLKDFEKPYFVAGGEVGKPGKYELRGDTTVTQAVALAGGFNSTAKHSQVLLFRRVSDEWVSVKQFNEKNKRGTANLPEDMTLDTASTLLEP